MYMTMKNSTISVSKQQWMLLGFAIALLALAPLAVIAGTGGTEFEPIWTQLTEWTQGILGRVIAGAMVLVGIIAGVVRQSLMAFAVGIGGAVGLYNAPTIIDNVMSATLPVL
jgi:conjugal transfer pilus assembly protein TraA